MMLKTSLVCLKIYLGCMDGKTEHVRVNYDAKKLFALFEDLVYKRSRLYGWQHNMLGLTMMLKTSLLCLKILHRAELSA